MTKRASNIMYTSCFTGFRNFIKKDFKLTVYQWRIFKSLISVKHYKKGENITCDSEIFDSLFFINYGIVTAIHNYTNKIWFVYYNHQKSKQRFVDKDLRNVLMHDFCSYMYQAKSRITFKVYEDCEVLQIKYADLQEFFQKYFNQDSFNKFLLELENQRFFKQLDEQFRENDMESLVVFKNQNKYLYKKLDDESIAEYLNIDKFQFEILKKKKLGQYSEIKRM
jgi:CRP-like cAMP-binding protein